MPVLPKNIRAWGQIASKHLACYCFFHTAVGNAAQAIDFLIPAAQQQGLPLAVVEQQQSPGSESAMIARLAGTAV